MKKTVFYSVLLSLAAGIFVFAGASAQEDNLSGGTGFRVSPPRQTLTINAGESMSSTISIRNVTSERQTAVALVEDFEASEDESGTPRIITNSESEEPSPYSIRPFVQPIDTLALGAGEQKDVLITLSIPEEASPGSYFGVIRFINDEIDNPFEGGENSNVSLNASVGVIFLVNVPGETTDLLSLEEVGVSRDGSSSNFFSQAPDSLFIRLRNEGNTFQAPFGDIKIKDWNGNTVQEINFNSQQPPSNVLPQSVRRFTEELEGIGSFGRYSVEGFVSYSDGSNIITVNTTFWVIPWGTVLLVTAIIVGGAFFATRGIKSYNRAVIKRAKGKSTKNMK